MNEHTFHSNLSVCRALGQALTAQPITVALPCPEDIDAFAGAHALVSLIGSALPQDAVSASLKDAAKTAAFKQIKANAAEIAISRKLSEQGIRHIILKGSQLQQFYPQNAVRSSADIDIFIDRSKQHDATAVLQNEGFTVCSLTKEDIGFQKLPRYHVELHMTMEGHSKKQQAILLSLAENALPVDGCRYTLCDNDCYIYTMFHLYKHFVLAGAGVRMFLDLFMMKHHATLDHDYIDRHLKALGIDRFADTVCAVNRVLFEGDTPSDEIAQIIAFVFHSHAYGVQSAHLALASLARPATKQSRVTQFIRKYCFDRYSMTKRYPVLERFLVLYPFCCFHRVIYGLLFKRTILKDAVAKPQLTEEYLSDLKRVMTIAGVL